MTNKTINMTNKTIKLLAAGAALLTLSPAGRAQTLAPLSAADTAYLTDSAQGSVSDLAHGEAGVQSASTNELRQYAIQIVEDHSRLNMQLYQLAQKKGVALPVTMKDEDRKELEGLVKKSGKDFDTAFLQDEVRINTQDVADGQKELTTTQDPEVKAVVREYLDTETVMLARAQAFLAAMGGK